MFIAIQTILSILIIFQASTVTLSFSSNHPTMAQYYHRTTYQFSLKYHPDAFERAVECARNYDMCDVDELLNLANELEDYQGCFYEDGSEEACKKETEDRFDLANLLLLQGELQERMHYLEEGNLFAYDVQADRDMHDRDDFIDKIVPALDV